MPIIERYVDIFTIIFWASSGFGGANIIGIAMNFHPLFVLILTVIGECVGSILGVFLSDFVYQRFLLHSNKVMRLRALHNRFNDFVFGLVAPFFVGGTASSIIAYTFGIKSKRFYWGLFLGIVSANIMWNCLAQTGIDIYDYIAK